MDKEFLQSLGVEQDFIAKILEKHQEEITVLQTEIRTGQTEIATLRNNLVTANETVAEMNKVDVTALQNELEQVKQAHHKDKQEFALRLVLGEAGCEDADYLIYKEGDKATFDQNGALQNKDAFLEQVKQQYKNQFVRQPEQSRANVPKISSAGNPSIASAPKAPQDMTYQDWVQSLADQLGAS